MKKKELLIVTGATGGLGKAISMYFAALAVEDRTLYPILCCRNKDKAADLRKHIEPLGLTCDDYSIFLTDLSLPNSANELVSKIKSLNIPIRTLINNAASMFGSYQTNDEGIELTMAVNFYSSAKLAEMLAGSMVSKGSIINVVSLARKYTNIDSDFLTGYPKSYTRINHYAKSKLALSIFTADMAQRFPNLYINTVDPGIMDTNMIKMDMWIDRLADCLFRPFTLQPYQSLEAIKAACKNTNGVSGYVFTRSKHFPIEDNIAKHPLKERIRTTIRSSVELITH